MVAGFPTKVKSGNTPQTAMITSQKETLRANNGMRMGAKKWMIAGASALVLAGCVAPQKLKGVGAQTFSPHAQDALQEANGTEGGPALAGMAPTEFDRAALDQWQSQMTSKMQQMSLNESAPSPAPSQAASTTPEPPSQTAPPAASNPAPPTPVAAPMPSYEPSNPGSIEMPDISSGQGAPAPRIPQSPM